MIQKYISLLLISFLLFISLHDSSIAFSIEQGSTSCIIDHCLDIKGEKNPIDCCLFNYKLKNESISHKDKKKKKEKTFQMKIGVFHGEKKENNFTYSNKIHLEFSHTFSDTNFYTTLVGVVRHLK